MENNRQKLTEKMRNRYQEIKNDETKIPKYKCFVISIVEIETSANCK